MWRAPSLVRRATSSWRWLVLLRVSPSLESHSIRSTPRTLCGSPFPTSPPPFSSCVQSKNNLNQSASPVLVLKNNFARRKGSTKPIPARRRSVSTPLSLPNPSCSLGGRCLYPGVTYQPYATVSICLRTHHSQTR